MEKEFVPYAEALELKELGFDEPCLAAYSKFAIYNINEGGLFIIFTETFDDIDKLNCISAPLYQQVFRWFREKYGLYSVIDGLEGRLYYKITQTNEYSKEYNTYEEAELECLKKLIEIVKND